MTNESSPTFTSEPIPKPKMVRKSIEIPERQAEAIKKHAEIDGTTQSRIIWGALEFYLQGTAHSMQEKINLLEKGIKEIEGFHKVTADERDSHLKALEAQHEAMESLKVDLAEAEVDNQFFKQTINLLKVENSHLTDAVESLLKARQTNKYAVATELKGMRVRVKEANGTDIATGADNDESN